MAMEMQSGLPPDARSERTRATAHDCRAAAWKRRLDGGSWGSSTAGPRSTDDTVDQEARCWDREHRQKGEREEMRHPGSRHGRGSRVRMWGRLRRGEGIRCGEEERRQRNRRYLTCCLRRWHCLQYHRNVRGKTVFSWQTEILRNDERSQSF